MDMYEAKAILESELVCRPNGDPEVLEAIRTYLEVVGDKEFCAVCGNQIPEDQNSCCNFERYVK